MEFALSTAMKEAPEAADDLMDIFKDSDVTLIGKCLSDEEDKLLFWANQFFSRIGYCGSEEDQKRRAIKVLKDYDIEFLTSPAEGLQLINLVDKIDGWILLTPANLLMFLHCAKTQKARVLRKGLLALFRISLEALQKDRILDLEQQVSTRPLSSLATYHFPAAGGQGGEHCIPRRGYWR